MLRDAAKFALVSLFFGALVLAKPTISYAPPAASEIQDETTPLERRFSLNFTGAGVSCVDNAVDDRTDCTIAGGGSGGAPTDATYVTLTTNATLTDERVLTGTANRISVTDNGAGNTVVLSTPQDLHTSASPSWLNTTLAGYLDLTGISTPAAPSSGVARLYSSTDLTKSVLEFEGADGIVQRLARDNVVLGYNNTGGSLPAYSIVYFSGGATGGVPHMDLARADSSTTMPAIGALMETTANGAVGRVLVQGRLTGINTTGFSGGDRIYVSSTVAGGVVLTPPSHPNLRQRVAVVASSAVSGTIDVNFVGVQGEGYGTNNASWSIGDGTPGARTLQLYSAGNTLTLTGTPTGTNTLTLPDTTGTLAVTPLTTKGDLYTRTTSADTRLGVGTDGLCLKANSATSTGLEWATCGGSSSYTTRLELGVNGAGGSPVTTGAKGRKTFSISGTIVRWRLVSDTTTNVTLDVWKANGAIPTNANSITASAKPSMTAAEYATSATLTGWTTAVTAGDVFILEVEANSSAAYLALELEISVP